MRKVLTSGTELELIWQAEGRWFTLPAVNCYAGSQTKPLADVSLFFQAGMRGTSDVLKKKQKKKHN